MVYFCFLAIDDAVRWTEDKITEIMIAQELRLLRNLFALSIIDWECFDELCALLLSFSNF